MTEKKTGYSFWSETLQSPRYVAAPMVDMSELAFRLLCRRYGSQVCYSPMFHSQQFLQDSIYRSDTFSTSPEDRPLIVQFCANDPSTFVSAASMVVNQCDAIDLNLGCPQSIAKKGHYGAFLQDEWELISSLIKKASNELPVPVTCKMRILPGESVRSVEYAKMLEHCGCSVLAVHGRTRDQKGHATGLASWDVIRDIKESVNIPVIANGNILSFEDVQDCLNYTKADAVMSAEGLLHNPALFSNKNPPVWEIVEEYLNLAEIYATQFRHIRNHLFRILYLCVRQDAKLMDDLTNASNLHDFRNLCVSLKILPQSCLKYTVSNFSKSEDEDLDIFSGISLVLENSPVPKKYTFPSSEESIPLRNQEVKHRTRVSNETHNGASHSAFNVSTSCDSNVLESYVQTNFNVYCNSKNRLSDHNGQVLSKKSNGPVDQSNGDISVLSEKTFNGTSLPQMNMHSSFFSAFSEKPIKCLPIWLCHSRPRILYDSEGKGWFQRYCETGKGIESESKERGTSKKKLRKERHHARVLEAMKEKRKTKKLRRKQKLAEEKEKENTVLRIEPCGEKITKKEKKEMIRQRMTAAKGVAPKICIDLGFTAHMTNKELNRLSSQLRRLYGSNRHAEKPLHLYFCNFNTSDPLYAICCAKNDGFSSYVVDMVKDSPEEIFSAEDIIYLSPDSENVLSSLDNNKVYVIGGIVDETVYKGMSLEHAKDLNVQTARLPILENLERSDKCNSGTVLTVNQVFDILLKYYETNNWIDALSVGVPQRKGFRLPSEKSNATCSASSFESQIQS